MRQQLWGLLFTICLYSSALYAETPVRLEASHIAYTENSRLLKASENVHLKYGDMELEASEITLDTDSNFVWSKKKVTLSRGEDRFESNGILMDLNNQIVTVNKIYVSVIPPEELDKKNRGKSDAKKEKIFIRAETLTDTPDYKHGTGGMVTTCTNPEHFHNFVYAKKFTYVPKKSIKMYNVWFYNRVLFVPLYFWLPYYNYALGHRKWVWNFPTIGRKEQDGWGYFIQNQIDYNYDPEDPNKESSILIDWYEAKENRKGSIGLGIRHYYKDIFEQHSGQLYYYNYDFEERDDDTITNKFNKKMKWENTYTPNDKITVDHTYESIDVAERINSRGQDKRENKNIAVVYDDLGDKYKTSFDEKQNFNSSQTKTQSTSFSREFNGKRHYGFTHSKNETYSVKRRNSSLNGDHTFYLPGNATFKNVIKYTENDSDWSDSIEIDKQLKAYTTFEKRFNSNIRGTLSIDQIYDLDQDTVTSDIALNNFLHKAPEINIYFDNLNYKNVTFKQQTTVARYQETRYDNTTEKIRKFPEQKEFTGAPNTYIFKQDADLKFDNLPQSTTFTFNLGVDQYVFKTPEKDIFNGDALYSIEFKAGHSSDFLSFIKLSGAYTSQYAPIENNSPFYEFQKTIQDRNEIQETITFHTKRDNIDHFPYFFDFSWSHSANYSWVREDQKWGDYSTTLKTSVTKKARATVQTGKKLNFSSSQKSQRFRPLRFELNITPSNNIRFDYDIAFDLNKYRDENITEIDSSKFDLGFVIGGNEEYQWEIQTTYAYNTINQPDKYDVSRYDMESINIVKNEHKRKLSIGYRKLAEEFTIVYTFNAFPNDPLELTKQKDVWKVEGRFNEKSKERL